MIMRPKPIGESITRVGAPGVDDPLILIARSMLRRALAMKYSKPEAT
jgi:hypothetical protein